MWDPLRRKEVADTPEESVRQWFIQRLADAGVPMSLMMSEVSFKFGEKPLRADIMVFDRSGKPLAIVECKRPTVKISPSVAEQALLYNAAAEVALIMLTNGKNTYIYRKDGSGFTSMDHLPTFQEMLCLR